MTKDAAYPSLGPGDPGTEKCRCSCGIPGAEGVGSLWGAEGRTCDRRICLGPHLPQLHSGLGEGRPPGFGQRDGSRWHQKREQVLPVFGWRGWDGKHHGPSPAQNKDVAPSSAAHLLNQRNHPPLQPEWALGGWIRLHNILKRGN